MKHNVCLYPIVSLLKTIIKLVKNHEEIARAKEVKQEIKEMKRIMDLLEAALSLQSKCKPKKNPQANSKHRVGNRSPNLIDRSFNTKTETRLNQLNYSFILTLLLVNLLANTNVKKTFILVNNCRWADVSSSNLSSIKSLVI